jgi:predicted ATP-binding protein involved in virulence
MQLERIRIQNLFGRFIYDISLRRPEKITIIHAPNGFGKTVLLTLVHAFFSRQFSTFSKYQFDLLSLYFDNRTTVNIRKIGDPSLFPEPSAAESPENVVITLDSLADQPERYTVTFDQLQLSPS